MFATATLEPVTAATDLAPLVIDEFDHWHNLPDSMLSPTSITWNDPVTVTGRVA